MYIYDNFPSRDDADRFVAMVGDSFAIEATAYDEQRDDVDPFPGELTPPVVYVERELDEAPELEHILDGMCRAIGGRYVGT